MKRPTVLIVDDERYTRDLFKKVLREKNLNALFAANGEEGLKVFSENIVDVIILDQKMPGMSGLDVLKRVKTMDPDVVVVMMTGYGTIEDAVEAMRNGAFHYLTKPFNDLREIEVILDKALQERSLLEEVKYLRAQTREASGFGRLIGKSRAMRNLIDLIKKVAPTDSSVLLQGESGTGKELIAKTIHENSLRAGAKFVAVDCASIPEALLESILFGFHKGAFTGAFKTTKGYFEEADGGTLFLDEITETSPKFQASLLRVIQEKEFSRLGETEKIKTDFRLIAATNRDIKKEVESGRFREDLYYRISVIPIHVPPLRERREDIPLLLDHFLHTFNRKLKKKVGPFTPETLAILEGSEWKGNVRELINLVERIVTVKEGGPITPEDLPDRIYSEEERGFTFATLPYKEAKETFERLYLQEMLKRSGGNIARMARESGIKRQNLYSKLKKYGLK